MTKVQVREIANTPIEESMNEQYTGIANSLISIECFKGSGEMYDNNYIRFSII